MENHPICPSCKKHLDQMPGRKKKCKFCNEYMYVRTRRNKRVLITEDERIAEEGLALLDQFGVSPKHFEKAKRKVSSPFERDVIWGLFNELIQTHTKKSDYQALRQIYHSMAVFLDIEGKDTYKCLAASHKMALLELRNAGFKTASVLTGEGCNCGVVEGTVYEIADALKEMPIPNKNCTQHQKGTTPFARCLWNAGT